MSEGNCSPISPRARVRANARMSNSTHTAHRTRANALDRPGSGAVCKWVEETEHAAESTDISTSARARAVGRGTSPRDWCVWSRTNLRPERFHSTLSKITHTPASSADARDVRTRQSQNRKPAARLPPATSRDSSYMGPQLIVFFEVISVFENGV